MMPARRFVEKFFQKFSRDETTTLAASLAFYTALSLGPMVILFVTLASQFSDDLQRDFVNQVQALAGNEAAVTVQMVIEGAKTRPDLTSLASAFGVLTLLFSASLFFGELRTALNRIFGVKPRVPRFSGYAGLALHAFLDLALHIGFALSFIIAVIVSLLVSSFISAALNEEIRAMASLLNIAVSYAFYAALFTCTFRYLPDRNQPWRRALRGGVITSVLFVLGKELIAFYLGNSAIGSAYGAAGSIVVLLAWVYYSTLITFIGAQLSALLSARA
jgi:membrane protein